MVDAMDIIAINQKKKIYCITICFKQFNGGINYVEKTCNS